MTQRMILALWAVLCLAGIGQAAEDVAPEAAAEAASDTAPEAASDTAARYVEALQKAYPEAGLRVESAADGLYLVTDSARILVQPNGPCPPVSPESLESPESLDLPDPPASAALAQDPPLCAVFRFAYPAGPDGRYPERGFDPGRIRNQALLMALYGDSRKDVERNSVRVNFLGKSLYFNARQGAAAALERVSDRLEAALREDPALREYLFPVAGTFVWRHIKGTDRLSAHSFAISIDLNAKKGLYWQWTPRSATGQLERIRREYPQAIVDAFEAEGFIWGGKWDAYDYMHFEYRPELLVYGDRP